MKTSLPLSLLDLLDWRLSQMVLIIFIPSKHLSLSDILHQDYCASQNLNIDPLKLAAEPEALQHLLSFQYMYVSKLPNLELFPDWLGNLKYIVSLSISKCPKLSYSTYNYKYPTLTNLQRLGISSCPKLVEQCEKESGNNRHKIYSPHSTHP